MDAVLPKSYAVKDASLTDIPFSEPFGNSEYDKYVKAEYEKAAKLSDSLCGKGVVPGRMFRICVADGHAFYVVTTVARINCMVEWRGFCPDRYTDHFFGYGRQVKKKDVEQYIRYEDSIVRFFGKK